MDRESLAFLSIIYGLDQEGVEQPYTLSQIRDYAKKGGIDLYLTPWSLERTLVYLVNNGYINVESVEGKTVVYTSTGRRLYLPGRDISSWEPVEEHPPSSLPWDKSYSKSIETFMKFMEAGERRKLAAKERRQKRDKG